MYVIYGAFLSKYLKLHKLATREYIKQKSDKLHKVSTCNSNFDKSLSLDMHFFAAIIIQELSSFKLLLFV